MDMRQQEPDFREETTPSSGKRASGAKDDGTTIMPEGTNTVVGPTGKTMTRADLPPPGITRWVVRRKAEVVAGVRGGLITLNEACRLYELSKDEFRSWQRLLNDHGMAGLRVTNLKKYRKEKCRAGRSAQETTRNHHRR